MKRFLVVMVVAMGFFLLTPLTAFAFGVKDVEAMSHEGIPDSLIVQKIEHSGAVFHLNAKDLHQLQQAGVSNEVVGAMLRTEDAHRTPEYYGYYGAPWWPYYSYGDPWWPGRPAWSLGLDFGYYRPYYHAYRPFHARRGFGDRDDFGRFRGRR